MGICMHFRWKSGSNLRLKKSKIEAEHKARNEAFQIEYFVRTGNPRYLGTKQDIDFFSKVI